MNSLSTTARFASRISLLSLAFASMAILVACESGPSRTYSNVNFELDSSHDSIYVGESVTVWAETENTIGREPEIKWTTTGGDLEELRNGSVVRVTFDTPGTYKVSGRLELEDGVDRMDNVTVLVRQLP